MREEVPSSLLYLLYAHMTNMHPDIIRESYPESLNYFISASGTFFSRENNGAPVRLEITTNFKVLDKCLAMKIGDLYEDYVHSSQHGSNILISRLVEVEIVGNTTTFHFVEVEMKPRFG